MDSPPVPLPAEKSPPYKQIKIVNLEKKTNLDHEILDYTMKQRSFKKKKNSTKNKTKTFVMKRLSCHFT